MVCANKALHYIYNVATRGNASRNGGILTSTLWFLDPAYSVNWPALPGSQHMCPTLMSPAECTCPCVPPRHHNSAVITILTTKVKHSESSSFCELFKDEARFGTLRLATVSRGVDHHVRFNHLPELNPCRRLTSFGHSVCLET